MAGTPDTGPTGSVSLRVSTQLSDVRSGDQLPDLSAYAFSPGGALLQSAELDKGKAELKLIQRKDAQAVRVVVGPRVDTERADVLAELFRLGAAEEMLRIEGGASKAKLELSIPRPNWLCWILGLCTVRGTLLKRTTPGGLTIDLPVCDAEVEIYEVDPFPIIIKKIPDDLIDRLRQIVLQRPVPPGPPDPGPFKQSILELLREARALGAAPAAAVSAAKLPADVVTRSELAQLAEQRFAQQRAADADEKATPEVEGAVRTLELALPAATEPDDETMAADLEALAGSAELRSAASQGVDAFRASLITQQELVRPIFCWLFPLFVTMQLVATAETDDCGRFSALFSTGCSNDVPDLYFVAYRRIFFGIRIPIYKPLPVACYTYWNYACGTEVTLITTSPFAQTCPPCGPTIADPRWVNVVSIGHTSLAGIYGSSQTLTDPSRVGLTGSDAPFGGLLRLNLDFDNALRDDLNVMYYRVSWKKAGTFDPWVPLELECHRHYTHVVSGQPVVEVYSLGPHVVNGNHGLFEIPPALPPAPDSKWSPIDGVEDTTNAKFPTGGSQPAAYGLVPPGQEGIYKLRVELFDAGGNPVDIDALGIHFVVPNTTDLSGTIHTIEAASLGLVPGPPVDTGNAFVMRLHIDNNATTAVIHPALLNGSVAADANCGLIRYGDPGTDTVTIAYTASHPNGFADYSFEFKRGTTPLTPPSASGQATGTFSSSPSVGSLLSVNCTIAGFAENLNVIGRATDGWSRLGYDAHDLAAFVLAPPKETP